MKKFFLLLKTIFIISMVNAQQGVAITTDGTNPDNSAMLDIKSNSKGFLTPRMTTAQRTAIASPAKGLIVFDTETNSFWFYNGAAWNNLSASVAAAGWSLTGNSGTNPASTFMGTTDNTALSIRTNNQTRLTVTDDGNIGINTTTPTARLDVRSATGTTGANFHLAGNSSVNVRGLTSVASNSGTGGAYGADFTAIGSGGTSMAAAVSAYAQSGYKNYGFFGSVLTSAGQWGYGVYATATGSPFTTGGYLSGDGTGVEAIGGNIGVKGTGVRGGEFTGTGTGVVGSGPTGGKFTGTRIGIETTLQTATNTNAFPQYGISSRVINTANTDQVFGVSSYVDGKNAISNVIGIYSEPHGSQSSFLTSFYGAGNVNISGNYYSSSDAKLKQNIKPIQSITDKIMQLKPSSYQYRTEEYKMNLPKGNQFGLIAQDIQKVFPELVADQVKPASFDEKTNEKLSDEVKYLGINYTGLIPIIISGVQEQQQRIKMLEEENVQLKKDIAQIKAKLGL